MIDRSSTQEAGLSWDWCQANSDTVLSCGLQQLCGSSRNSWGEVHAERPGVYLFNQAEQHLYIGESLNIGHRVNQHCSGGTRSTFLKNYADHCGVGKDAESIKTLQDESTNKILIQSLRVDIARKELEEFGIVNLPTLLNRFQRDKRRKVVLDCDEESIWGTVQNQSDRLIEEGVGLFDSLPQSPWLTAQPSTQAGLYKVAHKGELIYIGESTNIAERYKAHSNTTYFSALRRSIGTKVFSFDYVGKKKFSESDDNQVTNYLLSCEYSFLPVSFGRRELEEHLIHNLQPILNRKSK